VRKASSMMISVVSVRPLSLTNDLWRQLTLFRRLVFVRNSLLNCLWSMICAVRQALAPQLTNLRLSAGNALAKLCPVTALEHHLAFYFGQLRKMWMIYLCCLLRRRGLDRNVFSLVTCQVMFLAVDCSHMTEEPTVFNVSSGVVEPQDINSVEWI